MADGPNDVRLFSVPSDPNPADVRLGLPAPETTPDFFGMQPPPLVLRARWVLSSSQEVFDLAPAPEVVDLVAGLPDVQTKRKVEALASPASVFDPATPRDLVPLLEPRVLARRGAPALTQAPPIHIAEPGEDPTLFLLRGTVLPRRVLVQVPLSTFDSGTAPPQQPPAVQLRRRTLIGVTSATFDPATPSDLIPLGLGFVLRRSTLLAVPLSMLDSGTALPQQPPVVQIRRGSQVLLLPLPAFDGATAPPAPPAAVQIRKVLLLSQGFWTRDPGEPRDLLSPLLFNAPLQPRALIAAPGGVFGPDVGAPASAPILLLRSAAPLSAFWAPSLASEEDFAPLLQQAEIFARRLIAADFTQGVFLVSAEPAPGGQVTVGGGPLGGGGGIWWADDGEEDLPPLLPAPQRRPPPPQQQRQRRPRRPTDIWWEESPYVLPPIKRPPVHAAPAEKKPAALGAVKAVLQTAGEHAQDIATLRLLWRLFPKE